MPEIRQLMLGMLFLAGIMIGMTTFYGDLTSNENLGDYGYTTEQIQTIKPDDVGSMQVIDNITTTVESMQSSVQSGSTGIQALDLISGFVAASLNALTLPFSIVFLFQNLINQTAAALSLPDWIISVAYGAILIVVVFEVMAAFNKWRN